MQRLERMENQTHNPDNHSVTATVDHFSVYLLLSGVIWDAVWENEMRRPEEVDQDASINIRWLFSTRGSVSIN